MLEYVEILGIAAGLLQALGYVFYIQKSLRKEVDPNPATWLMFAYGVALLTILEWDRDASFTLLVLPIVCGVMSIFLAILCWRRGTLRWPTKWEDKWELGAFKGDIGLTTLYASAWFLYAFAFLNEEERSFWALLFLIGSNATTFTAFIPILRSTYVHPSRERMLPWLVWTSAYCLLGGATILEEGVWTELLIYPVSNAFLHGAVAVLARPQRRLRWKIAEFVAKHRRHPPLLPA